MKDLFRFLAKWIPKAPEGISRGHLELLLAEEGCRFTPQDLDGALQYKPFHGARQIEHWVAGDYYYGKTPECSAFRDPTKLPTWDGLFFQDDGNVCRYKVRVHFHDLLVLEEVLAFKTSTPGRFYFHNPLKASSVSLILAPLSRFRRIVLDP